MCTNNIWIIDVKTQPDVLIQTHIDTYRHETSHFISFLHIRITINIQHQAEYKLVYIVTR